MQKVLSALLKLKEMHSEYKDIVLNPLNDTEGCFNYLHQPTDDMRNQMDIEEEHNGPEQIPEDSSEQISENINSGLILDTCLQPPDLGQQLLSFNDGIFALHLPRETHLLESMAFPVQFPDGKNTLDEPHREIVLSPSRYFNARLFSVDNRFARDTNYIFFAQFITEIHLAFSSMSIQLRKSKSITRDGRRINSSLLQERSELDKLVQNNEVTRFMQPLRGTPAYWEKTLRDLFAMLRQLGTPTFFCTFSAAEMRWPEVITAIKAQQGESIDFSTIDWQEKCDILRSNPATAMRMFEKRVEALISLILSPAQPIGEVIDWFYRVEFQQRGSPHIHALFWVKDSPVFEDDPDQAICDFVDQYISCKLPDCTSYPELHQIVTEVQTHSRKHSKSCKKNKKHCRFGFPKPPMAKTIITQPKYSAEAVVEEEIEAERNDHHYRMENAKKKVQVVWELLNNPSQIFESITELLNKASLSYDEYKEYVQTLTSSSVILMERQPKDSWINGYNPVLLKAWNANMDIQFILDPYSCIMYILSYISKAEHEMSDYLKRIIKESSHTTSERESMKEVMHAYAKNREVSAQEAVARTCSLKLKSCSRTVIFIPTDDNAVRMSLPMKSLQNKHPDDENVWMTGLKEKYQARPNTPEFENMCMAEFASEYRILYGEQKKSKNVLPLQNNKGHIQKRSRGKPAIIRYARFSQQKNPEKFYGTLLKLYLPHRRDTQLQSITFRTYQSFYACVFVQLSGTNMLQSVYSIVKENKKSYEKHSQAIEKAIEDFQQYGPVEDAWTTLAPETELIRLESIMECQPADPNDLNEQDDIPDCINYAAVKSSVTPAVEVPRVSQAQIRKMYQSLNETQASIFYAVRNWCKSKVCEETPEQFLWYVSGTEGTGKSHLIKCVYTEASKLLSKMSCVSEEIDISQPTVLLTAFTGTAAFNINGQTLHSLLKLPRSLKPPYQGLGNCLDEIRANLCKTQILIIDEISMVSKPLFAYVNWRLQQIKGNKKPFGGISILAVGDFMQLPPVRKAKPLCVYEQHVPDFWRDHFKMITLIEIMRQKDDLAYAEMLNRFRIKQKHEPLSDGDREMLATTIKSPEECPTSVLHIYATNKEVEDHNSKSLFLHYSDIINIEAEDFKKDPQTGQMKMQATAVGGSKSELSDTLQIAVGAKVMITRNIDVEDGLVNGTFGKVEKIITKTQNNVPSVAMIGLQLDNINAGKKYRKKDSNTKTNNTVYIERAEEPLKRKGIIRRQFPLKLAFACTCHKVQGMTTTSAVVSLKHIFEPGMAYVALSRTTSLQGLHIIDFDEKKIFSDPEITESLNNMARVDLSNTQPLLQIVKASNIQSSLTIIHHNTEGLQNHIEDIKNHHELLLADVLCLTETQLHGSVAPDNLNINGYTLFTRNRHVSYTNLSYLSNRNGGGVALYVRNSLEAHPMQYIQNVTDLEYYVLKVKAPQKVLIACIYRPPDYKLTEFLPNLKGLLTSLDIIGYRPIVVCGDFNEDQLSSAKKPILEVFNEKGYAQVINSATTEKNSLLDLLFLSSCEKNVSSGILHTYYSYHNPVFCVL
ncbi:hypothetical protein XELAEV_18031490mg [Xenopus laevis]|uniref:ATP-dependent DNA helicase n=1 Tax=Xenopus laevis TaxID=8355 RepID=A0A974HG33_XENLA|nr:hypothetical protein XELAEV_18031490mg [Xenopus laevis]